jgi:hypothetical protein
MALTGFDVFVLHGMRVRSELPLSADHVTTAMAAEELPEVTVRVVDHLGDGCVPSADADLLLRWLEPEDHVDDIVTLHRLQGNMMGWLFSYAGIRFLLNETLDRITVVVRPHDDLDWVVVLLEGWVLSVLVTLRGGSVLHASSVVLDGQLIVFVGNSGQGKSTLAALLCATGGQLFSDDVLSVSVGGIPRTVSCHVGSHSLRIRPDAAQHWAIRELGGLTIADDRVICRPPRNVLAKMAVSCVLIPRVVGAGEPCAVTTLSPAMAAVELLKYPRTYHWLKREQHADAFETATAIASMVPVSIMSVPQGHVDPGSVRALVVDLLNNQALRARKLTS